MTLATLIVKLGAETLEFHREMEKAAERMERVGRRMARAGKEITKIFAPITVLAVAALTAAIKQSALTHGKLSEAWDSLVLRSRQLLRDVGAALTPAFLRFADSAEGLINKARQLVEWFNRLSPSTQDLIIKIGIFLAVAGPTILIVGELIKGFASLWKIGLMLASMIGSVLAPVFAFLLSPVGLVILAVGLLIAALALLVRHWTLVKQKGLEAWAALKIGVINIIDDMVAALEILAITARLPGAADFFTGLRDKLGVMRLGALRGQQAIEKLGESVEHLPLLPDWLRNLPKWFAKQFTFSLPQIPDTSLTFLKSADTLATLNTKLKESAQLAQAFGAAFDVAGARAQLMRTAIEELVAKGITMDQVIGKNGLTLRMLSAEFRRASLESQLYVATQKSLVDAFTTIGQQFGNILGGIAHGFHDFGNVLKQLLGNMLVAVGQTLIAFGTAGIAIKAFVHNPFGAIAAGVALVALGSALSGAAQRALDASAAAMPGSRPVPSAADTGGGSFGGGADVQGSATIVVRGDPYLDMSDPRKRDALVRAFADLKGYRSLDVRWEPS